MENEPIPASTPEPAPAKVDGRKNNGARHYHNGHEPRKVDGEKLLPEVVKAVLGSKTLKAATAPLSEQGKRYLSQAIKGDVDQWRAEFSSKLRSASEEMLEALRQDIGNMPAASRAFALSVLVDKAQLLEGKVAMSNASVNVQINNYGNVSKEDLIKKLHGQIDELPVQAEEVKE